MSKLNKNHWSIIDFISHSVNIDLSDKVETRFLGRSRLTIRTDNLSDRELNLIERVADSSGLFTVQSGGYQMLSLSLGGRK